MGYQATVYKVMIASPSDVPAERSIVREQLHEWNVVNSDSRKVVLLPVGWETHSVPEMGDRPQALINKRVLQGCDILIGVFWTRIGTATGEYASGTVEEIEEHIKSGKPVMLYFSNAPVVMGSIDLDQYNRLNEFKVSCQSRGIYEEYSDISEFRQKLNRHLQIKMNEDNFFLTDTSFGGESIVIEAPPIPTPSREAAYLLKECANDSTGQILNLAFIGGHTVQVGGKNLIEDKSDRSRATWISAIAELERFGYIVAVNSKREIFRMTREGYDAADRIA